MSKERAVRWKMWMENPCWQELREMMNDITRRSVADEDRIPTAELNVAQIGECRGIRRGMSDLLRRVNEIIAQA